MYISNFLPKGDLLHRHNNSSVSVFKARLKSCTIHGKSYGFRVVYLKHSDYIILLEIYPKWGPNNANDISPEGVSFLLSEALSEKENNELLTITTVNQKEKIDFSEQVEVKSPEISVDEEE